MKDSIVQSKSFDFAVAIILMCQKLVDEKHEYVLTKQLIKSSTSIGANIREARRAQSPADFVAKMSISLKEAEESRYWLELLAAANYIDAMLSSKLLDLCDEIIRMLVSIVKTMREKTLNS